MEETLNVVKNCTENSLCIIDELGRGTSTFDGISIAHSILEDIIERIKCKCLFSTHYHNLLEGFQDCRNVSFNRMDYLITGDDIVHLYKLVNGKTVKSFGIEVAKVFYGLYSRLQGLDSRFLKMRSNLQMSLEVG